MKKNNYFIVSGILGILASLYSFLYADSMSQYLIKSLEKTSDLPNNIITDFIPFLEKNGPLFIIVLSLICLLINSMIIKIVSENKQAQKKGLLIFLSVLSFFLSQTSLGQILSLINIIMLLFSKKEISQKYEELPKITYQQPSIKEIIFGIIFLAIYAAGHFLIKFVPSNKIFIITYEIVFYALTFFLALLVFYKELKEGIVCFVHNFKNYIKFIFQKYLVAYLFLVIANLIILFIFGDITSVNEESLNTMPMYLLAPLAIVWAPIVEETLFRGVLRRLIKNNKVFIVISAVVFGLLHTISEETFIKVIIMAIPYSILGGYFAYLYIKTNNLLTDISAHSFQNTMSVILKVLFLK